MDTETRCALIAFMREAWRDTVFGEPLTGYHAFEDVASVDAYRAALEAVAECLNIPVEDIQDRTLAELLA